MSDRLRRLQESATAAYVLPLAVFMLLTGVPGWLRIENPELPWYQRAPEHWLYPLQTVVTGALLLFFSRHYRFGPWRGLWLAVLLGTAGIFFWILPAYLHQHWVTSGVEVPTWAGWLGFEARTDGFNPEVLSAWPFWQGLSIGMRFIRLVIIVPLVEEIFWRGFLMRYIGAGDRDWKQVPFGEHSWPVYGLVTFLVMLAHHPADYAAAFIWGSLVYFLAVRTRSLGACIVMHAVANLLLGGYVMATRQWGFW
ncbi:CAAX prenyl protease-related protein [Prosthecobacter sp. SYSU 5D2]|uniref:CAAX prenyl protease-related protein n=1 Tax=Prosthecobacter sp. SYSU 5D2 TaxID=3134134 RepID=UPI0031FE82DF